MSLELRRKLLIKLLVDPEQGVRDAAAAALEKLESFLDLDQIVKAYDIRGTVPNQFDAEGAHALGVGFA
ncbi:MAG: hypothetical protein C0614_13950, partial [Desulfuromonas sp.]